MSMSESLLKIEHEGKTALADGWQVRFNPFLCFRFDDGADDLRCLQLLADHLADKPGLAFWGAGPFAAYLLRHHPSLKERLLGLVHEEWEDRAPSLEGLARLDPAALPAGLETLFLAETRELPRYKMRAGAPEGVTVIEPDVLPELSPGDLPARAWSPRQRGVIYPIPLPEIRFEEGLDLILVDLPARNLGMMPNGLGYVHNALKKTSVNWQTLDLDIILYHRFHIRRLYDHGGTTRLPDGRKLPVDPWQNEHFDLWSEPQMLELFREDLDEIVAAIVRARPKVLGLSLQSCNEQQTRYVVNAVKEQAPEVVILVGGFSCYNKDIGLRAFPETEYMCIGEADLTVGPLMEMLAAGERPGNVAGVLSVHDDPDLPFIPAPMPHDLDQLEVVKYDWFDSLDIYRNWDGYQLTPVIASRGCRWSRCTFCAERFYWRIRSPKAFVDEMEWLMDQGCHLFMFNESDLNGMPEVLLEICEEIIRRDLKIKLTGQLRIHRKSDKHFFQTLAKAGFVVLRFGVDAFSANTLKLQAKGYDKDRVRQNLKDCWEAGIFTEVNWVIGVPGETWDDVQEGVDFIVENKPFIGRVANINPLILAYGSVYWVQPEVHNIHFRGDKDTLLDQHPRAVPAHLWYSDEPYIDHEVRREYFSKVVKGLYDNGFDVGAWAARIIEDVETGRDGARAGIAPTEDDQDGGAASKPAEASAEAAGSGEAAKAYDTAGGRADAGRDVVLEGGAAEASGEDAGADRSMDSFSALRGWDLDHDGGEDAAVAQEMQKAGAYLMRAAGNLPVLRVPELSPQLCVLRHSEGWVAASPAALKKATGLDATPADGLSTTYVGDRVEAQFVWTKGIVPQYEKPVGSFNVALYDGFYYAIPRGFGGIEWGKEDPANLTGVMVSETREGILEAIEAKLAREGRIVSAAKAAGASVWRRLRAALRPKGADAEGQEGSSESKAGTTAFSAAAVSSDGTPRLEGKLEGYRIYEYEGWYYGVPSSLGDIQLDEVDVMEMPGVIRDVSKDVLEEEIRGLSGRLAV